MTYTLLIAEDEQWVRRGLVQGINWSDLGINHVYEASDGQEALMLARRHRPDILITDIRMPVLDGLHLIMAMNEEAPLTQYVIVSGHADFSYAKTALYLGVREYITKPIDTQALMEAVKNSILHIAEQRNEQQEKRSLQNRLRALSWQEETNVLLGLVTHEPGDSELHKNRLESTNLSRFAKDEWLLIAMAINEARRVQATLSVAEWEALEVQIAEAFEQALNDRFDVICRPIADGKFICAICGLSKLVQATQHATLQETLETIVLQCKWPLSIGAGIPTDSLSQWPQEWSHALSALESSFFYGGGRVYWWEKPLTLPTTVTPEGEPSIITEVDVEQRVLDALMRKDKTSLYDTTLYFQHELLRFPKHLSVDVAVSRVLRACEYISRRLTVQGVLSAQEIVEPLERFLVQCREKDSLASLCDCFYETLCIWLSSYTAYEYADRNIIIQHAKLYLEHHYSENITLNDIANYVHLSSSYFSRVFSEEIGVPYSQYLMELRVEKAKQFLLSSTMRIHAVAKQVGYSDIKYFNRVFKRLTGVSPGDFRKGRVTKP